MHSVRRCPAEDYWNGDPRHSVAVGLRSNNFTCLFMLIYGTIKSFHAVFTESGEIVVVETVEADWCRAGHTPMWSRDGRTVEKCVSAQNWRNHGTKTSLKWCSVVTGRQLQPLAFSFPGFCQAHFDQNLFSVCYNNQCSAVHLKI